MPGPPQDLEVILNPNAEAGRAARLRGPLQQVSARVEVTVTPNAAALADWARSRDRTRPLAIVGGDGTISSVLSALHTGDDTDDMPPLCLLRGGTMNTVARGLGVPRLSAPELLARVCEGKTQLRQQGVLKVQGQLGFLFGAGVIVGFLQALYEHEPVRPLKAVSLLARGAASSLWSGPTSRRILTPLRAGLRCDGDDLGQHRHMVLLAATVPQLGLGFAPFGAMNGCGNHFRLLTFHGSMQALALRLPAFYRGLPPPVGRGVLRSTRSLDIDCPNDGISYSLDGDLKRSQGPLRVEAGPPLQLWIPHP